MSRIAPSELGKYLTIPKLEPKSKEQIQEEFEELRQRLGLMQTNGEMEMTRSIIRRVGSLANPSLKDKDKGKSEKTIS